MIGSLASRRRRIVALAAAGVLTLVLGGCVGQTIVDQASSQGNYNVSFSMDPARLNPPQLTATLNYALTDAKTGKPVILLDTIYGAQMHNILISRDLSTFEHSYTGAAQRAEFSMSTQFLVESRYYSYTLFKPSGSALQTLTGTVQAGQTGPSPDLSPDSDRVKDILRKRVPANPGNEPHQSRRSRPVGSVRPRARQSRHAVMALPGRTRLPVDRGPEWRELRR